MSAAPLPWRHIVHITRKFTPLWAGSTVLFALLGYAYTQVRTTKFSAHQVLLIRNQASGEQARLGRFASQTDLKSAQETILQLARSRDVVHQAIERLGPAPGMDRDSTTHWPSQEDIENAKKSISILPPKNSEFGATEVIHLQTREVSVERASLLCQYVREALVVAMQKMRAERTASVIEELKTARDLARQRQDEVNRKLQEMEVSVGSDLGELRALTDAFSGSGNNQLILADVQKELQQAELDLDRLLELESLLKRGQEAPDRLLVTGSELLSSQPTLKRLKDGLIDAQLAASQLSSTYTQDHPSMKAALASQREILQKMREEIRASIDSMAPQLRVARDRVNKLQTKQTKLSERLERLAAMRVKYSNLVADFNQRSEMLASAEAALSDAEAVHDSAYSTELLSPLGQIQVGDSPIGPNDLMLVAGSIAMGLLFGCGMVFLVAPGPDQQTFGRRWSDYSGSEISPMHVDTDASTPRSTSTAEAASVAQPAEEVPSTTRSQSSPAAKARRNLQKLVSSGSLQGDPNATAGSVERRRNPR